MRTIEVKDRTISVDGRVAKATWTDEAAEDLKKFHGIAKVVGEALVTELDSEFSLTDGEKLDAMNKLAEHFNK